MFGKHFEKFSIFKHISHFLENSYQMKHFKKHNATHCLKKLRTPYGYILRNYMLIFSSVEIDLLLTKNK